MPSAAIVGRGGPGIALPVFSITAAGPDTVHSWGAVTGPAVIEALWISTNNQDADARTLPMIFPQPVPHTEGADLSAFLREGIALLPRAGAGASVGGYPHNVVAGERWRFWPRKLVPWPRWAPGVFVRTPAAIGVTTIVVFSVRFLGGGNPDGREGRGGY